MSRYFYAVIQCCLCWLTMLTAQATVLNTESLSQKVAQSEIIVVAQFQSFEGHPPYTHANPPVALFKITQNIRGASVGSVIRIERWDTPEYRAPFYKYQAPPLAEQEADRLSWMQQGIVLPDINSEYILFVADSENTHMRVDIPYPGFIAKPDTRKIVLVKGYAQFDVAIAPDNDQRIALGQALPFELSIANLTDKSAIFSISDMRMSIAKAGGDAQNGLSPAASASNSITLPAHAKKKLKLDWRQLFSGVFDSAGDYWMELDIPAQGGEYLRRHYELYAPTQAYACSRADQILRVRVVSTKGTDIQWDDPVYLRLRGERLAHDTQWPVELGKVNTARYILCAQQQKIMYAEPDTESARQSLAGLLENDPPEWWSHQEDNDPRFAQPVGQPEMPGSEMRKSQLQRRLGALP